MRTFGLDEPPFPHMSETVTTNHEPDTANVKPLRRPLRRRLTNAELLRIAAQNPPPREWLEGGEECPF